MARHPAFQAGNVHTGFIDEHFDSLFPPIVVNNRDVYKATVALILNELSASEINRLHYKDPFTHAPNMRLNHNLNREYRLKANDEGKCLRSLI